jgi:hypothetical protein
LTRIEPDENPPPAPPRAPYRPAAKALDDAKPQAQDSAATKREMRRKLEVAVETAREKLALAKRALEDVGSPQDEERQVIQQRVDRSHPAAGPGSASTGGMLGSGGMHGGAQQRSNCRTVKGSDGRAVTTCPTMVPNDAYYDRVKRLEDAVRAAEEELEAAEQAYRRGND